MDWDARTYDRVSEPQVAWGQQVLSRLALDGHENAMDVGCGSGRLTAELAGLIPAGRVLAVDLSSTMIGEATRQLGGNQARVWFAQADASRLPVNGWADLIFSTATFHWVLDHDELFKSLFTALRPGGRLVAQCGGGSNLARMHAHADVLMAEPPYAPFYETWKTPWHFADAEAAAQRLTRAGFVEIETSLHAAPARFPDARSYREFISTVILRPHLSYLPDLGLRDRFLDTMTAAGAAEDPPFTLDYWRLNLAARRPPALKPQRVEN